MGNINKTFICGSCRSNVKLISEGTFFVCPYCQTKNTIVEKNKLESDSFIGSIRSKYFGSNEKSKQIINFGWLLLFIGISCLFSIFAGFAMYALLLYLISLLACLICPCIGAAGLAGTTALWGSLLVVDLYVALFFCILIGIVGLVGLLHILIRRNNEINTQRTSLIFQALCQILIASIGYYYLSLLF